MKHETSFSFVRHAIAAAFCAGAVASAQADTVTDWNHKVNQWIGEAKLGTPPAVRLMAYTQTAVLNAVNAAHATTPRSAPADVRAAAVDAAVAAANRAVLAKLLPAQQAAVDAAYQAALSAIPDGPGKSQGVTAGERAAANVFASRATDTIGGESYRPYTTAGVYVPTVTPAVTQWPQRTPWVMSQANQFRAPPPPALDSSAWAQAYNEVKDFGARNSTRRSAEQTDIGRFWEYSLPAIYFGVVHSVAQQPGRDIGRNAQLFAAAAQAMDDALIAVFDSKYHYNLWRPATAIRNGDIDGNDATARDASWTPLIDAPLHPEYPSGHGVLAGALGAVLKADIGDGPTPLLTTSSPTLKNATRQWKQVDDFVREVCDSRVYAGIHYRFAVDAAAAMGGKIGELTAAKVLRAQH